MKADELAAMLTGRPMLTRADIMRFLGISARTLCRYQLAGDFPKPQYVYGPRWTPEQIGAWQRRQQRKERDEKKPSPPPVPPPRPPAAT